jgi:hypothetical protein
MKCILCKITFENIFICKINSICNLYALLCWQKFILAKSGCYNEMLGEKKVELDGREWNLELRKAALAKGQTRGLKPRDNRDELMEFIEPHCRG